MSRGRRKIGQRSKRSTMPIIDLEQFGPAPKAHSRGIERSDVAWSHLGPILKRGLQFQFGRRGKSLDALSRAILDAVVAEPNATALELLDRMARERPKLVQEVDTVEGKIYWHDGGRDRKPLTIASFRNRVTNCRKQLKGRFTVSDKP